MDVLGLNLSNPNQQHASYPYSTSIASSASSSSSSVFSLDGASSQSSLSSTSSGPVDVIWENGSSGDCQQAGRGARNSSDLNSHCPRRSVGGVAPQVADAAVPLELRQNPRRTNKNTSSAAIAKPPPALMRQCERKVSFVDNLVDSATQIVELIWPLSVVAMRCDATAESKGVLPLRTFIQETLRRSRTSYSTLQVALYYLILIKAHVPNRDFTMEQPRDGQYSSRAMQCGRRMFLAALILASKYLQDRNYSARAWSKISGLETLEINDNELTFLKAVGWKLHISESVFQRWTEIVLKYTPSPSGSSGFPPGGDADGWSWQSIIPKLTPELDTIELESTSQRDVRGQEFASASRSPSPWSTPSRDARAKMSNDVTPTPTPSCTRNIPMTLEPTPRMDYTNQSLPSLPKLNLLPTPQMTPQSSATSTPAASISGSSLRRRPSICAAMSRAQSMCVARTTTDYRPLPMSNKPTSYDAYPTHGRRSSLARSASSTSSPESMVSDVSSMSSRSSRSSSISSVASGTSAPAQPRLAVRATRRCANLHSQARKECRKDLVIATPIDESCFSDVYASPDIYHGASGHVPDMSNFAVGPSIDMTKSTQEAAQGLCELAGLLPRTQPQLDGSASKQCRKRGRPVSGDHHLQSNVRHLMSLSSRENEEDSTGVLPDSQVADSFLVPQPKAAQYHSTFELGARKHPLPLSLPKSTGSMKRACCGGEALRRMVGITSPGGTALD